MLIQEAILARLQASTLVQQRCGGRVYHTTSPPEDQPAQDASTLRGAYVVFRRISAVAEQHTQGDADIVASRFEFLCIAPSGIDAARLSEAVVRALSVQAPGLWPVGTGGDGVFVDAVLTEDGDLGREEYDEELRLNAVATEMIIMHERGS